MIPANPFRAVVNNVVVCHHLYIGALLLGWQYPVNIIGALVFLDDLVEHTITADTPLRLFFDKYISPRL